MYQEQRADDELRVSDHPSVDSHIVPALQHCSPGQDAALSAALCSTLHTSTLPIILTGRKL